LFHLVFDFIPKQLGWWGWLDCTIGSVAFELRNVENIVDLPSSRKNKLVSLGAYSLGYLERTHPSW
jgi:hypothetical protein